MKTVALALQGGGAHGAFVWGVLDRLCQERQLKISAISGASSGAFNAAVYLYGLASGGAKGAREALEDFWTNVAKQALWSGNPFIGASFFGAFRNIDNHPLSIWIEQLAPIISPYNLPFLTNSLEAVARAL
jgi:NTE family protein